MSWVSDWVVPIFTGSLTTFSSLPLEEQDCCLAGSAWRQVWLLCWRKFALNLLFQAYGTPILKPVYRKMPHHIAHWGVILEATKGVPSAWRSLPFSETLIMRSEENIFFPWLSSLQCYENAKDSSFNTMLHKACVLAFYRKNTESIKQTNALKILTLPMQTFLLNETLRLEKVTMLAWLSGARGFTILTRPKADQRGAGMGVVVMQADK